MPKEGRRVTREVEDGGSPTEWERWPELATYRAVGMPFVSRGHFAGRWLVEVSVNSVAASSYERLTVGERFAEGSILVKKHKEKTSGALGPVFAMIKRETGFYPDGGDWEFVVTDPRGVVDQRGQLPSCARCHAEASTDWVFGQPR